MGCLSRLFWSAVVLFVLLVVLASYAPSLLKGSHFSLPSSSAPGDYVSLARRDASDVGLSADLFVKQIREESGFQPNVVSPAGAIGIAQFMPATAAGLGFDPHDPVVSLKAAAHLMASYVQRYGEYAKALAAYNAGSGALAWAMSKGGAFWGAYIPAETRRYICAIVGEMCS